MPSRDLGWQPARNLGQRLRDLRENVLSLSQQEFALLFHRHGKGAWKRVSAWENSDESLRGIPLEILAVVANEQGWPRKIFEEGGPLPSEWKRDLDDRQKTLTSSPNPMGQRQHDRGTYQRVSGGEPMAVHFPEVAYRPGPRGTAVERRAYLQGALQGAFDTAFAAVDDATRAGDQLEADEVQAILGRLHRACLNLITAYAGDPD